MSNNLKEFVTDIANALREKEESTELINPQDFGTRIRNIQTKENLDAELDEQDTLLAELEISVKNLGDKDLRVNLPEFFYTATSVYHFQVNDEKILFSCDVNNAGLWVYDIKEKTWTQVYTSGKSYYRFQQVTANKVIVIKDTSSILLYNAEDDSAQSVYINSVDIV